MEILYMTDLHGDVAKYEKSKDMAVKMGIKCIVNGGDMFPKHRDISSRLEFIEEYLPTFFKSLKDEGIIYICVYGNDDLAMFDDIFEAICEKYDNIFNITGKKIEINGYEFIGLDKVLDYRFGLKDRVVKEDGHITPSQLMIPIKFDGNEYIEIPNWNEYVRDSLLDMKDVLEELPKPDVAANSIYVIHMPPLSMGLGRIGPRKDVGSREIYQFIVKKQPLLTLHGHIHESPDFGLWDNKIGNTICIQPGQTPLNDRDMNVVYFNLKTKEYARQVVSVLEMTK